MFFVLFLYLTFLLPVWVALGGVFDFLVLVDDASLFFASPGPVSFAVLFSLRQYSTLFWFVGSAVLTPYSKISYKHLIRDAHQAPFVSSSLWCERVYVFVLFASTPHAHESVKLNRSFDHSARMNDFGNSVAAIKFIIVM